MSQTDASSSLLELSCAHVVSRALHVVAELGVADLLDATPRSAVDLAEEGGWDADALHRVLRLLEGHGVFCLDRRARWGHTMRSRRLRSDEPDSERAFVRMMGMPFGWDPITVLGTSVRTGQPGVAQLDPPGAWDYLEAHPAELAVFQQAMADKSRADIAAAPWRCTTSPCTDASSTWAVARATWSVRWWLPVPAWRVCSSTFPRWPAGWVTRRTSRSSP